MVNHSKIWKTISLNGTEGKEYFIKFFVIKFVLRSNLELNPYGFRNIFPRKGNMWPYFISVVEGAPEPLICFLGTGDADALFHLPDEQQEAQAILIRGKTRR